MDLVPGIRNKSACIHQFKNEIRERKELDGRIARAKANDLAKAVDGLHARMNALLSSIDAIPGGNGVPAGEAGEPSAPRNVDDVFSRRGIK